MSDGTVVIGNLEWQEETRRMTWDAAAEYAKSLGEGWRVPTRTELLTLLDDTRCGPACSVFPDTPTEFFWSSSPYAYNRDLAWVVDFDVGNVYGNYTGHESRVRCVRTVESK